MGWLAVVVAAAAAAAVGVIGALVNERNETGMREVI
jgi:hypothetical protein